MRNKFSQLALILTFALLGSACATGRVIEPKAVPIGVAKTLPQIAKAITAGGADKGWQAKPEGSNRILLTLNSRSYVVRVTVEYSQDEYTVRYKDSENLEYNAEKNSIHKKYFHWVRNLEGAINKRLAGD
jgi:hypothetical protein